MPPTLPTWLRSLLVLVGLAIIGSQALANYAYDRAPNVLLVVVGAVLVGVLSPEKLDRFFPGGKE